MSLPKNGAMEPVQSNGLSSAAFGHLQGPTNSINDDDDDIQATTAAYDFPVDKIHSSDQQHERESKPGLTLEELREVLEFKLGPLLPGSREDTTGNENTPTLFTVYPPTNTDDLSAELPVRDPPTNTDDLSAELPVREDDDPKVDIQSTETQNYHREGSVVTLIPHELVLSVSPGQGSSCSHNSANTHPSPHIAATTSTLRYSGQFGESGVIKTNVATPHIIAHLNDSNNQKNGSRTSSHLQSSLQESSDAHFGGLEDFIDSPCHSSSPYCPSQLRPELQVLTERELENF